MTVSAVRVDPPSAGGARECVQTRAYAAGAGTAVAIENNVWYDDWPEGLTPEKTPGGDDEVRRDSNGG